MLNANQKAQLEAIINVYIEDIATSLKPEDAISAFQDILNHRINDIPVDREKLFQQQKILDSVQAIEQFFKHGWPQNRPESNPYFGQEEGFSTFKLERSHIQSIGRDNVKLKNGKIIPGYEVIRNDPDKDTYIIAKEPTGLLGLTSYDDDTTPAVVKGDVVTYISYLINKAIEDQKKLLKKEKQDISSSTAFFSVKTDPLFLIKNSLTAKELQCLPLEELINLGESERNRLIKNVQSFRTPKSEEMTWTTDNYFLDGLNALLIRHISLSQFAEFDKEQQILLTTNKLFLCLMDFGIDFNKLSKLSSEDLKKIFSWLREDESRIDLLYHRSSKLQEELNLLIESKPSYSPK